MFRRFTRSHELRRAFAALSGPEPPEELRDRLVAFYTQADRRDLVRANPRLIAEQLTLAERPALRLLVAALAAGLLDLHWEVSCPVCGALNHRGDNLGNLRHETECDACRSRFAGRLDNEVRVSFSLHQRLRPREAEFDQQRRNAIDERLGVTTGHTLLLLPDFQRLFPQQRLLPEESLDVTQAALLFTDLAGSTALYARRGDPRAYHLVRLHFDVLFQVAEANHGLMVKTIGDAIMAAFETPTQALRAALEMQGALEQLNQQAGLQDEERLILKVGLHAGPCLSVTLNGRPDYFGTAVNIAARVQGLSHGGDIVLTEAIHNDPEARWLLAERPLVAEWATLKGIEEPVCIHRLRV